MTTIKLFPERRKQFFNCQLSNLKLPSFFATLSYLLVSFLLQFNTANAQFTGCKGCTANDDHVDSVVLVQLNPAYATDNTQPQFIDFPPICSGNTTVTGYLKIAFNQNATTRYGISLTGNILVDSVYSSTFSYCNPDTTKSGPFVKYVTNFPITFTCGTQLSLQNLFIGWGNSAGSNVCPVINNDICQATPHCEQLPLTPGGPPIIIVTPLSVNFGYTGSCSATQTAQSYSFNALDPTNGTTGGTPPYSYSWTIVRKSNSVQVGSTLTGSNPSFNFSAFGPDVYTVTLTITDAATPAVVSSISKDITVTSCCTTPVITNQTPAAICSGGNVSLGAGTFTGSNTIPSGTTYSWLAPTTSGITGLASGTDQTSFSTGTLTNTTTTSIDVTYTVTPKSATCTGNSFTIKVTVNPNSSIASVTGTSPLCIGGTATYTANTVVLGGGTGAWSSSDPTVASVDASGKVTALKAGSTDITFTITGGCNGPASAKQSLTVTDNSSIASVTGTSPLCIGGTATYTANTVVLGGGTGAWSSSDPTVASVDASGKVTALKAGSTDITFTITGGCNGPASAKQSLTVTPNSSIASVTGTSPLCIGGTATYTANTVVLGGGTGAWSSSDPTVASIDASGKVTALKAGSTDITFTITGGCNGPASAKQSLTVTDNSSIASVTGTSPLCIGGTATYTANTVVLGGGTGAWSSSDPTVASVDASGKVTALKAGSTDITFTITGGCNGPASAKQSLTVTDNSSIASVTGTSPLCIGGTATYTANTVVLGGGTGAWSSSDPTVASVDASGKVTALKAGSTDITFTITGGCNGPASAKQSLTVTDNSSIASVTGTSPLCIGGTATYTANTVVLGGGTGAWSSSDPTVASVDASGKVTALKAGSTDITFTITGGCNGPASAKQSLTVTDNSSIASVTGTSPLCIGGTATYTPNTVVLGGGTGAWSSSDPSVASVDASGKVTALKAGSTDITFTITGGCNGPASAKQSLTVTDNSSIASVTGTSPLCIGGTATYTPNTVVLGGGTGAWSSSDPTVASVDASGKVTALKAGSTDITFTITGGCNGPASAKQSLTVTPNSSIASVTGTSPLCIGGTATYTANTVVLGGGTGAWSSSDPTVASVDASGKVTALKAGSTDITFTITGGCNGPASANQSLTVTPNSSIASVTGTSPLCIGGTATYTANTVVLGGGTGAWSSSDPTVASVDASGKVTALKAGSTDITFTITGGCNGPASAKQSLTVTPNASIASVTGLTPVCIGATPTYTANSVVLGGGTGAWSSDNTAVATVNASTGVVTAVKAGTANIIFTITGGCKGTSAQQAITVSPNNICPQYSGDYFANTASTTTGGYAIVTVKYNISSGSGSCNDITKLKLSDFTITPTIQDNGVSSVTLYTAATYSNGVYSAQYKITLSTSAYSGSVLFVLSLNNPNYSIDPNCSDNPLVTISTLVTGFVTGGGFIIPTNSGGTIGGAPVNGLRNNFGFNIKSGKKLQGNWNTIIRRMENGNEVVYQVKSNTAATLVVTKITNTSWRADMSFTSANFQNLTCSLCPVGANNGTVLVSVYDNGEPGAGIDKILITIKDHNNVTWYTSDAAATNSITYTNLQLLNQGNIQIHTSGGAFALSTNTQISQTTASPLSVSAYPNPFTDKVTFTIVSPVSGKASLDVYNIMGQKLHTVYQGYLFAGRGQVIEYNVPSVYKGSLIYTLRVGDKQVNGKIVQMK